MNLQTIIIGTKTKQAWQEVARVDGNIERMWRNAMSNQMSPFLVAAIGIAEQQRALLALCHQPGVYKPPEKRRGPKVCHRGGAHSSSRR